MALLPCRCPGPERLDEGRRGEHEETAGVKRKVNLQQRGRLRVKCEGPREEENAQRGSFGCVRDVEVGILFRDSHAAYIPSYELYSTSMLA